MNPPLAPQAAPLLVLLHRLRPLWRALLAAALVITAWQAFKTGPELPTWPHADKLVHAAAFAVLGGLAALAASPGPLARPRRGHLLLLFAGLLAYGAGIELVQSQLPARQADGLDLLADGVGAAAGLWISAALLRWTWRQRPQPI